MAHALALAARGLGRTWPNPAVGCVIVQGQRIVGRGWTQPGGRPHAETMALAQAGKAARGATAYVTLEPCAHHGQTPPCTDALIAAGIARVVTALTDPDPRVSGRGHAALRAAGIEVTEDILPDRARALNAGFLKRVTQGLPYLTLKLATSLDGRIATSTGQSRWITSEAARRAVHAQRSAHDAVMVGIGTALADDPSLTIRDLGTDHQPLRIVIDSHLRLPLHSRLAQTAHENPVWLCHAAETQVAEALKLDAAGVRLIACTRGKDGKVDLTDALKKLAAEGLTRIYCEGGGTLAASLIRENLVDELVHFTAGTLIGGDGHAALAPLGITDLATAPRLTLTRQQRIGPDTCSHWRFA
jgi:diaminohydroxyphosphoribosylaminopyrimidine deaminase / 5-amino-6-(5-phosphoribosylamino)uracil reductase